MSENNSTTAKRRSSGIRRRDLTGLRAGILTVIQPTGRRNNNREALWECVCDCGTRCERSSGVLRSAKSCGCLKHGLSLTPTYQSWNSMRWRCLFPSAETYHNYGGRGIKICQRWLDVRLFCADMGERANGFTIERINNEGHYSCGKCPECLENGWTMNCEWITKAQQGANRRTNRYLTAFGRTETLAEWSRITGIPKSTIKNRRLRGNLTDEQIVTR